MRFLMFNLVVGAAIFYLLGDGAGPASRPVENARQAVSATVDFARKVAGTESTATETKPIAVQAAETRPVAVNPVETKSVPNVAEGDAPRPQVASIETAGTAPPVARSSVAAATPSTAPAVPAIEEKGITPPPASAMAPEAKYVASRPVHAAPPPGQTAQVAKSAAIARSMSADPEVLQRRAEVLGTPAKPAKPVAPGKFAVKDGEKLMSPGDRVRELSRLVDDMELVYFNSLGN